MTTRQLAAQYIQEQIDIMRKHGSTPRLTPDQQRNAIASAERTFEAMQERRDRRAGEDNGPDQLSHPSPRKMHA